MDSPNLNGLIGKLTVMYPCIPRGTHEKIVDKLYGVYIEGEDVIELYSIVFEKNQDNLQQLSNNPEELYNIIDKERQAISSENDIDCLQKVLIKPYFNVSNIGKLASVGV